MKEQGEKYRNFYWQSGYGAFSVNPAETETVVGYINTQKEHHRTKTFQEELRAFFRQYQIDFDERYVWD